MIATLAAALALAGVPDRQAAQTAVVRVGGTKATLRAGVLLSSRTVALRGTLRLDGRVLRDLRVTVGATSRLTARSGGSRRTVIRVRGGRRTIDPVAGIVRLTGVRALAVDVDAGSDLAPGGMIDWGLSTALRAAAPGAISVFDSAICSIRESGCEPDLGTPRRRSTIHFPVIDGTRRDVEGQGGLRIGALTIESPRLRIAGRRVTLRAFVSTETVAQRELDLATFTTAPPLRRGPMLAWTTGPGALTPEGAALLGAVTLDPLTFSIDA